MSNRNKVNIKQGKNKNKVGNQDKIHSKPKERDHSKESEEVESLQRRRSEKRGNELSKERQRETQIEREREEIQRRKDKAKQQDEDRKAEHDKQRELLRRQQVQRERQREKIRQKEKREQEVMKERERRDQDMRKQMLRREEEDKQKLERKKREERKRAREQEEERKLERQLELENERRRDESQRKKKREEQLKRKQERDRMEAERRKALNRAQMRAERRVEKKQEIPKQTEEPIWAVQIANPSDFTCNVVNKIEYLMKDALFPYLRKALGAEILKKKIWSEQAVELGLSKLQAEFMKRLDHELDMLDYFSSKTVFRNELLIEFNEKVSKERIENHKTAENTLESVVSIANWIKSYRIQKNILSELARKFKNSRPRVKSDAKAKRLVGELQQLKKFLQYTESSLNEMDTKLTMMTTMLENNFRLKREKDESLYMVEVEEE